MDKDIERELDYYSKTFGPDETINEILERVRKHGKEEDQER